MAGLDVAPPFEAVIGGSAGFRAWRMARRQQIVLRCVAVVLFAAAVCAGGFPLFMQYVSSRELSDVGDRAARRVHDWPYPLADDAFAAARAYNRWLAGSSQPVLGEAADPFRGADAGDADDAGTGGARGGKGESKARQDAEYRSLLDAGNGVMGSIHVPKVSIDVPIYHGTSSSALAVGAGHLYGSSLPVGGGDGHAVITGHRGLVEAAMFTRLDELRIGDYFYLKVMGRTLGYRVDRVEVIEPSDTSRLRIVRGEDRVTLMTCTPYGVNTHRLLVSAVRSAMPGEIPNIEDAVGDARHAGIAVGVLVLCVGLIAIRVLRRPWHVRRHAASWPDA